LPLAASIVIISADWEIRRGRLPACSREGVTPEAAMLVLSRKVGERILIGENITVTVVRISATDVRLGIDAPPEATVIRSELARVAPRTDTPHESRELRP
jgi:carbon storage regulator